MIKALPEDILPTIAQVDEILLTLRGPNRVPELIDVLLDTRLGLSKELLPTS